MYTILLLCFLLGIVRCCPREELIGPACICKNFEHGPMMLCSKVMSPEELIPPIRATDPYSMFSLAIIESALSYVPSDLFKGTKYQKIRFANSQIMALSDTDLAFEGLEDRLEEIRADNDAEYVTEWDWSQLRNHRRLEHIDIHKVALHTLNQEFPPLKSLTTLGISRAEISFLHPEAFRGLDNLKLLVLKDNEISEMSRGMFPDPADQLVIMDLSGNHLRTLPSDLFTNMPSLRELDLNRNRFVTLEEATFKPLLEQLEALTLEGNEFRCDCRLKWIVSTRKPSVFRGSCSLPANLKDLPLKNVDARVLWCL